MGFWGSLGKGLLGAGGAIAAPFTGGASLATVLPAIMGGAGSVIGAMGESATKNRAETGANNLQRDLASLSANNAFENQQMGRANLELNQQAADRTAANDAYRNALRSALAMHMQDASINIPGIPKVTLSGGARPSALGEEGRQAGAIMNNQALQHLMNPQTHAPLEALKRTEIREAPKAGFWEKLAGPLGMGLTAAGSLGRLMDDGSSNVTLSDAPTSGSGVGSVFAPTASASRPFTGLDPRLLEANF